MQDTGLFLSLAEIAGVFVGFGALIAVRSGGTSDPFEVMWVRGVVSMGLVAVLAALAPVVIGGYGLDGHEVWTLSSVLFLVAFTGAFAVNNFSPESRTTEEPIPRSVMAIRFVVWAPSMVVLFLAPIAIALGLAPVDERALYVTLVVLTMFWCGIGLLMLVFAGRRPASA